MHVALYRSAALSLALVAMLLRAILPDGWMPNDHAGGTFFTICSVEPDHRDANPPKSEHTHAPCAFSAASTLSPPTFVGLVFGASTPGFAIAANFADEKVAVSAPYRPNAARAPPPIA